MFLFLCMLIVGFVPTEHFSWLYDDISGHSGASAQSYAMCSFSAPFDHNLISYSTMIVSMLLLMVSLGPVSSSSINLFLSESSAGQEHI